LQKALDRKADEKLRAALEARDKKIEKLKSKEEEVLKQYADIEAMDDGDEVQESGDSPSDDE
jgi:hypothetical protein